MPANQFRESLLVATLRAGHELGIAVHQRLAPRLALQEMDGKQAHAQESERQRKYPITARRSGKIQIEHDHGSNRKTEKDRSHEYLARLNDQLKNVTDGVEQRVRQNEALTLDTEKGEFHLAASKAVDKPDSIKILKELIEMRLPKSDLADVLIDIDNRTNFLHHFLPRAATRSCIAAMRWRRCWQSAATLEASAWRSPPG